MDPGDARHLAEECGITFSYSVSDQLSAMLPPLEAAGRAWSAGKLPQGFPVEEFDPMGLRWVELADSDAAEEPGLYRARAWQGHVHALKTPTGASLRVEREPAVYEVLRWDDQAVIEYDEDARELWVPSHARLPLMHERAAVLCTGQLPWPRKGAEGRFGHAYANIPPQVAHRIARSLSQELNGGLDD